MLYDRKKWDREPWNEWPYYRRDLSLEGFAFWMACLISGCVAAMLWILPVLMGMQESLPYLYRFFENLR